MSWWKSFTENLFYRKPFSPPYVFTAGAEDGQDPGSRQDTWENPSNEKEKPRGKNPSPTNGKETGAAGGADDYTEPAGRNRQDYRKASDKRKDGGSKTGARGRSLKQGKKPRSAVQQRFACEIVEDNNIEAILKKQTELSRDLDQNRQLLARIFRVPQNKDVVFRTLSIGTNPPVRALLVFIDGITDSQVQNMAILQPLMLLSRLRKERPGKNASGEPVISRDFFEQVRDALVPGNQVAIADNYQKVVNDVLGGNSALFLDGCDQALLVETKGWHFRNVGTPQVEAVIRGPQEGFTEMLRVNTSLVRKIIQRPSLVTEFIKVGEASPMQCAIMYLDDLANPDLVREVKRRLESLRGDFLQESGLLEQMIEDSSYHPVPQTLSTERPDRVASNLMEGKVAVLVEGNPFVLVLPCTFFALMQAPEDAYVRWPFGSFVRAIRYLALFMALLLPAHYVAIVAYHQEFIPTDLLLVMTGAREKVPFPSIVEVLVMEVSFELIREAGIRIPGTVGTTLGIVGALILGQAAVAANIVSPILIIVVAVTALGSFTIPNYSFSLSIRVMRFVYILLASVVGLLGILVGFFIHVGLMVHLKSFGVPFMAPAAPVTHKSSDYFMRGPAWEQEKRPDYMDPLQIERQPRLSRGWLRSGGKKGDPGKQ